MSLPNRDDLVGNPTAGVFKTALGALYDYTADLVADSLGFTPAGNIESTNIQDALTELDTKKLARTGGDVTGALHLPTPVTITSSSGVLTLTEDSNSFVANGTEAVTSITGWIAGIAIIRWNTARTLTYNSTSLILQGAANRATTAGDIGMYEMTAAGAREIAYFPTTVQSNISFPLGTGNYIVSGRKVSSVSGFQVNLTEGQHVINNTSVSVAANAVTIPARSAALVYDKADGTTDKVLATLPYSYIDNNTVGFWDFTSWDGSSAITNAAVGYNGNTLAVACPLTKTGTASKVDGYVGYGAQGDGSSGYFVSTNATNIPTGANIREIDVLYTANSSSLSGTIYIYGLGTTGTNTAFGLKIVDGVLNVQIVTNDYSTGYALESGKTYLISLIYNSGTINVFVNGALIHSASYTLNTGSSNFYIFRPSTAASNYGYGIVSYVEIRNSVRTAKQISDIANALLLPNRYYTQYAEEYINGVKLYDIATPENAVSSGSNTTSNASGNAFNKDGTASAYGSLQTGSGVSGISYIGTKVNSKIRHIRHANHSTAANNISSVLLQYSVDNGATWTTIQTQTLPTTASTITDYDVADYAVTGSHYIRELANASPGSGYAWYVAEIYMYTDVQPTKFTDIRSILPANAISLGFARTNSTSVIAYNDSDYGYGRREKAYGGNRRVFLGWKYFSGTTILTWDNPFANGKIRLDFKYYSSTYGSLEIPVISRFTSSNSIDYGAYLGSNLQNTSKTITLGTVSGGVVCIAGTWITSGYIGCYAEVLEDD